MQFHHLSTEVRQRFTTDEPHLQNVKFSDFIIDGYSLHKRLEKYELVPSLGDGTKEYQEEMISYFLLQKPHPLLWYRAPILVCPECADLGCGFISAKLDRRDNLVIWSDFYKDNYQSKINIGPFYFRWDQYCEVIKSTLTN